MEIPDEVRATHRDLSPAASRFLDYVIAHPEAACGLDLRDSPRAPQWMSYPYQLQVWPTFIGASKQQEIMRATVGVSRLMRSIPERVFGNDARRISEFYGWGNELLTAVLLEPPNGLEGALARCDFVDSADGFKCVEVNGGANLGGWQLRYWEQVCRENPPIAAFIAEEGLRPFYRDPWYAALCHIAKETFRTVAINDAEINIALMLTENFDRNGRLPEEEQLLLNDLYSEVLAQVNSGIQGRVLICLDYDDLTVQGTFLWLRGRRIHAVLEYSTKPTPRHVFSCFKSRSVCLYNGPMALLLSDKRNLALLSQLEESDCLTSSERALVRDHVPWSREVVDCRTTFHGEPVSLMDFALAHRDSLVLKPADASAGNDVYIGGSTSPEEWSARLHAAIGNRRFLLQEYVRSRPYLFQYSPAGYVVHDLVWGTFSFGDSYGGGFLRMLPHDCGPSVINSARGATEGFMFEV